jgi:cobalt-zinc-cadmium efflux system outer membrane protein
VILSVKALSKPRAAPGRHRFSATALVPALALAACAHYTPAPLAEQPDLAASPSHLIVPREALHLPGAGSYTLDPARGFDMTGVAVIAVANNPLLRAERAKTGIARAQLFAAGLLPDPQLALSAAHPTAGPAVADAFSTGLSYVLDQVITRPAAQAAARAQTRSVDLDVLWQEWQVAQQARLAYAQLRSFERQAALLERYRALYAEVYDRSAQALRDANVTLDVASTNLAALVDAEGRLDKATQDLEKARRTLAATLGLAPGIALPLVDGGAPAAPDEAGIQAALAALAKRRPDLLALGAGYDSEEAKLRQAILGQFPALTVGIARARDTSAVYSWGPSITLSLPVFNGNRGNIAIEQATRERLRVEYQARLDVAVGEADQLRAQHAALMRQRERLERRLPPLRDMAARARRAYAARDLGASTYLQLEQSLLNQEIEAMTVDENLLETRIGLETVLGLPIAAAPEQRP